jgi:uncharacterized protein (DUF427 family)
MPSAKWNGAVIAEADEAAIEFVEGNVYFPLDRVKREYLRPSDTHTYCGWKGTASYYDVVVDGTVNKDAAWFYPEPFEAAREIAGYVAFWRGVEITGAPSGRGKQPQAKGHEACDTPAERVSRT